VPARTGLEVADVVQGTSSPVEVCQDPLRGVPEAQGQVSLSWGGPRGPRPHPLFRVLSGRGQSYSGAPPDSRRGSVTGAITVRPLSRRRLLRPRPAPNRPPPADARAPAATDRRSVL